MTAVFSASDIIQFAVRIEENGADFYRAAVRVADDTNARSLFNRLAADEDTHRRTFRTMLAEIEAVHAPPESFPGEYEAYLHSYVDNNVVFNTAALDKELAAVEDTISALEFAIRRELDSIAFYNEVKPIIPERQQGIVDAIIGEERSHFTTLCDLKKKIVK
jgi:rubrerythrin